MQLITELKEKINKVTIFLSVTNTKGIKKSVRLEKT